MDKIEQERQEQLEACIPDIWDYDHYLYVGANEKRFHFKDKLRELAGNALIEIVEIDPSYAQSLRNMMFVDYVYQIDILLFSMNDFSNIPVIVWSHGPSCMKSSIAAKTTIENLKKKCGLLVIMCPWGIYPPDFEKPANDDYSANKIALYPNFFRSLGMTVNVSGQADTAGSNLLAWWRK